MSLALIWMQGQEKRAYSEQKHHKTIHAFFIRKFYKTTNEPQKPKSC